MNREEIVERNRLMIMSIEESLLKRTDKVVLSKWSAASWWGFSELLDFEYNITFPKGYNLPINKKSFKVNWKTNSRYLAGIETFNDKDISINVYSPERTIVELIKDAKGSFNDVLVKTIKNFFNNVKYSFNKLMEYARMFKVENEVKAFMVMNKH